MEKEKGQETQESLLGERNSLRDTRKLISRKKEVKRDKKLTRGIGEVKLSRYNRAVRDFLLIYSLGEITCLIFIKKIKKSLQKI